MSANKGRNSTQKRNLRKKLFGGRQQKPCCFCRRLISSATATLEHVIPLSKGGNWEIENLRLSCRTCNQERGSEEFFSFKNKFKRNFASTCGSGNGSSKSVCEGSTPSRGAEF